MKHEALRWGLIKTRFSTFTAWIDGAGRLVRFWLNPEDAGAFDPDAKRDQKAIAHVSGQIEEYCAGTRRDFELALAPHGTAFQHEVWNALVKIPFGTTTSYGALAAKLGRPNSDGSLTGYGGGLPLKRALLAHEAEVAQGESDLFARAVVGRS